MNVEPYGREVLFKPDGIYSSVHYYLNPGNKREVILVGTIHEAESNYYDGVIEILNYCQMVIYEDPKRESNMAFSLPETRRQQDADWREIIFRENVVESFRGVCATYPKALVESLGLVEEWALYDYSKNGWISGDGPVVNGPDRKEFWEKFDTLQATIPLALRSDVVRNIRLYYYIKCDEGTLTRTDYVRMALSSYWGLEGKDKEFEEILRRDDKLRETYMWGLFDGLSQNLLAQKIGIKFGAGHMRNIRISLEYRGYVLQKTEELRAITLP